MHKPCQNIGIVTRRALFARKPVQTQATKIQSAMKTCRDGETGQEPCRLSAGQIPGHASSGIISGWKEGAASQETIRLRPDDLAS